MCRGITAGALHCDHCPPSAMPMGAAGERRRIIAAERMLPSPSVLRARIRCGKPDAHARRRCLLLWRRGGPHECKLRNASPRDARHAHAPRCCGGGSMLPGAVAPHCCHN